MRETGVVEGTWKRSEAVSVVAAVAAVVAAVVDEVAGAGAVADGDGGGGAWLAMMELQLCNEIKQQATTCFGFDGCVGLSHAQLKLQVEEQHTRHIAMARCSEQCMSYVVREPV